MYYYGVQYNYSILTLNSCNYVRRPQIKEANLKGCYEGILDEYNGYRRKMSTPNLMKVKLSIKMDHI